MFSFFFFALVYFSRLHHQWSNIVPGKLIKINSRNHKYIWSQSLAVDQVTLAGSGGSKLTDLLERVTWGKFIFQRIPCRLIRKWWGKTYSTSDSTHAFYQHKRQVSSNESSCHRTSPWAPNQVIYQWSHHSEW